ncbi:S1C family serine protease [Inhella crocodyli]|uniref:Serine protease n=1 Tax=Inhella crocodyli TaxID=2499851 RepID=A0A3S2UBU0_9BURK|nr:S1C family serine protease [Inhella crocodyli]RVT83845.1 serine protease [Inhella crocodyli]
MNMRVVVAFLVGIALLAGCAAPVRKAEVRQAREIPRGADAKPIQFKKVVVKLRRGEEIGSSHVGIACLPQGKVEWKGGKVNITDEEFTEAFREELEKYNYPVVGDPNALFDDPSSWKAELLVAGQINKLDISVCYPMAGFGNFKDSKGGAFVRVNWQVYGQLERKVIYETTTEGSFQSDSATSFGIEKSLTNAFAAAVQNLLADEKFHQLVKRSTATSGSPEASAVDNMPPLEIKAPSVMSPSLDVARKATVTIFAGGGHGSGFIVSADGYVLTNEHVVREARFVTVRLSNGRETLGDVVRVSSRRDVALIRLREQNLPAVGMALNLQPPIGADVYAIGTPRRESLDTTVTRGIISAYRDERGLKFLQSDVQIHPGNSGGPLVTTDGRVVGIAVQGLMVGSASQNLNFFVPIDDAIGALNLKFR